MCSSKLANNQTQFKLKPNWDTYATTDLRTAIAEGFCCLLGRASNYPRSLVIIHSLFVNSRENGGFTNINGCGTTDDEDNTKENSPTVVHIPTELLSEQLIGLRKNCFSSKRSNRKGPLFPSNNYLLTHFAGFTVRGCKCLNLGRWYKGYIPITPTKVG